VVLIERNWTASVNRKRHGLAALGRHCPRETQIFRETM